MKPSLTLLARPGFEGFWRRSLDEFKRLSNIAIKLEGLHVPNKPYILWDFSSHNSVQAARPFCDADIGGQSTVSLDFVPETATEPAHARFHGSISTVLPGPEDTENGNVERTGYAAWRTRDRPRTLFGKSLWDIDPYTYLALRVKADRRKYKVNLQTESIVYSDIHQHRLFTKNPGHWETILIQWSDFVRTNHGIVVEPQSEMLREKLRTIGIGLTDREPGPFELCISSIWATNALSQEEREELSAQLSSEPTYVPKEVSSSGFIENSAATRNP